VPDSLDASTAQDAHALDAAATWAEPHLGLASLADLFLLYGHILDELQRREVVRTRNQPLGDYAEWLTWRALAGTQSLNKSEKAFDVTADLSADLLSGRGPHDGGRRGARIQVKARSVSPVPRHDQLQTSPFHDDGFDYMALVMHEEADFFVRQAVLLPAANALTYAKPASARRDDVLRLWVTPAVMSDPAAVDITDRLRFAARS
jgi:hypothetical protein